MSASKLIQTDKLERNDITKIQVNQDLIDRLEKDSHDVDVNSKIDTTLNEIKADIIAEDNQRVNISNNLKISSSYQKKYNDALNQKIKVTEKNFLEILGLLENYSYYINLAYNYENIDTNSENSIFQIKARNVANRVRILLLNTTDIKNDTTTDLQNLMDDLTEIIESIPESLKTDATEAVKKILDSDAQNELIKKNKKVRNDVTSIEKAVKPVTEYNVVILKSMENENSELYAYCKNVISKEFKLK